MNACSLCGRVSAGAIRALAPLITKRGHVLCAMCVLEIVQLSDERERADEDAIGLSMNRD